MIDYHCHLLPGIDDGAADRDEALAMARALAGFGFREVCCTPHCIKGHYEISPVVVREAVRDLQRQLDAQGIALSLQAGMEYYLDGCFESFAANLLPLGDSRLVLCEAPPQVRPEVLAAMLELIVVQGFIPLVAHPERSEGIYRMVVAAGRDEGGLCSPAAGESGRAGGKARSLFGGWLGRRAGKTKPEQAERVRGHQTAELPEGCLLQANLGSFTGFYGGLPQRRAYELLQRGAYHCLASDLHDARSAPVILEPAQEKLMFNPALQKLAGFVAPRGNGGSSQLAFW